MKGSTVITAAMRYAIAFTFIASGAMKAANLAATAETVRGYCNLLGVSGPELPYYWIGLLVCIGEICLGILGFSRKKFTRILPVYAAVLAAFTWITYINITSPLGSMESCGCFGEIIHLDAQETFVKNIVLLAISLVLLLAESKRMKFSYTNLALIFLTFISASCGRMMMTDEERYLEDALEMAGGNRPQLEKVLSHYAGNPERLEAAQWLISNMPLHHSKTGEEVAKYRRYFEVAADQTLNPQTITDSLSELHGVPDPSKFEFVYDIQTLDSAFLVDNIDAAFEAREKYPWGKKVRWEDFLEFVLPYRLGDEPLELGWRRAILKEYGTLIDSIAKLPEAATPRIASDLLFKEWIWRKKFKWTSRLPNGPRIGPAIVEWKTGACREKADGMAYLLRAAGLPASLQVAPMRGDLNDTHSWGAIYDADGSPWLPEQHTDSAYKSIVPAAKVTCETFSINRRSPLGAFNTLTANPALCNPFVRDETFWYLSPNKRTEFKIPLNRLDGVNNGDTVYIASSSRMDWVPVGLTVAENDTADFGYVGERTVCVAGVVKNGKFTPVCAPFKTTWKPDGTIQFFSPKAVKPINIYSKYNLGVGDFTRRMVGATFEVSDSPRFEHSDTIHRITEPPKRLITSVDIENSGAHRCVRFMGAPKSHCNVSEIAFYERMEDTIPLNGRILTAAGFHASNDAHTFEKAWDGDPYSSVDVNEASGGWTGLDFGIPRRISRIEYSPRNRGNYIRSGYTYELYYYSRKGWTSLGTRKAQTDMLQFDAPEGALLYLHCVDAGKDERIFEYDNDRDLQIYW